MAPLVEMLLRKAPFNRAEGETDQNAGKKNNKEGHWYVVEMNVAERKTTVRLGTGADGGWGESKRVHAAAAAAKAAARLAHEQATRRAAEGDLGVWWQVHWQAKNYSTVPAV